MYFFGEGNLGRGLFTHETPFAHTTTTTPFAIKHTTSRSSSSLFDPYDHKELQLAV
jgi:hypothetical protein